MIERDGRDSDRSRAHCRGRIEASTRSRLENCQLHTCLHESEQRDRCYMFEERWQELQRSPACHQTLRSQSYVARKFRERVSADFIAANLYSAP